MAVLACPACSVLGCGSLVALAQQLLTLTLAKPIPQHTVSSWLKEQEGPWGAPRGFPPHGVPFICCFTDVGFGSCLTCINYRAAAPSLWQNQLWSSCPESAMPQPSSGSAPAQCSAALTISTSPVPMWTGLLYQERSKNGTSTCSHVLDVYPGAL